jgi:precorrin-8X/cobalt-precorrin-8 methylmutase
MTGPGHRGAGHPQHPLGDRARLRSDRGDATAGSLPTSSLVHPIEAESFRIIEERFDLSGFAPGPRAVVARVLHATADPELALGLVVDEASVEAGVRALRARAPVVCDTRMVAIGASGCARVLAALDEEGAEPVGSDASGPTRTAAAMRQLVERVSRGAVVVVGCAPSALAALAAPIAERRLAPALVVGLPVGFVGAAEAKEAARRACEAVGVPCITNTGCRGGSAAAAAVLNALARLAG